MSIPIVAHTERVLNSYLTLSYIRVTKYYLLLSLIECGERRGEMLDWKVTGLVWIHSEHDTLVFKPRLLNSFRLDDKGSGEFDWKCEFPRKNNLLRKCVYW